MNRTIVTKLTSHDLRIPKITFIVMIYIVRLALGQKMFSKEEVKIFFKILEVFWTAVDWGRVVVTKTIKKIEEWGLG